MDSFSRLAALPMDSFSCLAELPMDITPSGKGRAGSPSTISTFSFLVRVFTLFVFFTRFAVLVTFRRRFILVARGRHISKVESESQSGDLPEDSSGASGGGKSGNELIVLIVSWLIATDRDRVQQAARASLAKFVDAKVIRDPKGW